MLDPGFGQDGIVAFTNSPPYGGVGALATTPDGALMACTNAHTLKLTATGSLDPTFGVGGVADGVDAPRDVHVMPDGRILAIGSSGGLRRILPDGMNDADFGTNGFVQVPMSMTTIPSSIATLSDHSIIINFITNIPGEVLLYKRTPQGDADLAFGTNGILVVEASADIDFVNSIVVDSEDRILVAGTRIENGNVAAILWRISADGIPDPSFGTAGMASLSIPGITMRCMHSLVLPTGKLLLVGSTFQVPTFQPWIARLDAAGLLDTTFGTDGYVVGPLFQGHMAKPKNIHVTNEGSIILSGDVSRPSGVTPWAHRWTENGTVDPSFGTACLFTYDFGECTLDYARSSTLLPDGTLVIAGSLSCTDTSGYLLKLRTALPTSSASVSGTRSSFSGHFSTSGDLVVQGPADLSPLVVELFTPTGALVHRSNVPSVTPDGTPIPLPPDLAPGLRLLRITHPRGSTTQHMANW